MFAYFHRHKCKYEAGQIAPLMILVLVILIIMAMVTVNIYKVAMDKTYSANAVDAGALAAGSVMANVFNAVASSNAEMKKGYELAYYSMAGSVGIAVIYLIAAKAAAAAALVEGGAALGTAFPNPAASVGTGTAAAAGLLKAIKSLGLAITLIKGLVVSVSALYAAQLYFYGKLRETARDGQKSAVEQGHKFLFYNSGLGGRLPGSILEGSAWDKTRDDFSRFLDTIDAEKYGSVSNTYSFDWHDGQARAHYATSRVDIQDLDAFDLIATMMPFPALLGALITCLVLSGSATGLMTGAAATYKAGAAVSKAAASQQHCCRTCGHLAAAAACIAWAILSSAAVVLFGAGNIATGSAIGLMVTTAILLGVFIAGLLPNRGNPIRDDNMGLLASSFIICWIDDIIHDRRVTVNFVTDQEGADLGLWKTEYPVIRSYSIVDFRGGGQIRPTPVLNFDPSIIETDIIGK